MHTLASIGPIVCPVLGLPVLDVCLLRDVRLREVSMLDLNA